MSGAVSAASVHYSSDGKNISVTNNYVKSTLVTHVTTKKGTGTYGYGTYVTLTTSGKDIQGRNSVQTLYSFNGKPKQMVIKLSGSGAYVNSLVNFYATKSTITMNGKDSSTGAVFSATGVSLYRTIAGQKYASNTTLNMIYSQNGKVLAKSTQLTVFQYKSFNGEFRSVKSICTTKSAYTVGVNRKSVINTYYNRNLVGTLTGMKVSGTSQGTEKINNKLVSFSGKITISTKHDPRDIFNEGFTQGDYKEVLTSSSPTLLKVYPLEA